MYHYIFGLTILKAVSPYFRKHVLEHLDPHDFFVINVVFIVGILSLYLLYRYFFDKKFDASIEKIQKMKMSHVCCILILALVTTIYGIAIMSFDKHYNTPLLNTIMLKTFSMIALILVSIFIFKEKYTMTQMLGISMTLAGIYLITLK
jgi:drug/metabolite transporter (DMT)-like permease